MNLHQLKSAPPWEWPGNAGSLLLATLRDESATETDRQLAAELAGDLVVMNDELAVALMSVLEHSGQPQEVRARAAISLGPVLEQVDIDGFEDSEDVPITEATFHRIQKSLRRVYLDAGTPKEVRRRALEASARAPQSWHRDAIAAAFASDDEAWKLTAVFCMQFVKGFNDQILEALNSRNPDIRYEAVVAAGNWEIDAAWPHVSRLLASKTTGKTLLLAAIDAVATIRPDDAPEILSDLRNSDDDEVVGAVEEALAMAKGLSESATWDDEDEEGDEGD